MRPHANSQAARYVLNTQMQASIPAELNTIINEYIDPNCVDPFAVLDDIEAMTINKEAHRFFSKDTIWKPIFEHYFSGLHNRAGEHFKSAFVRNVKALFTRIKQEGELTRELALRIRAFLNNKRFMMHLIHIDSSAFRFACSDLHNDLTLFFETAKRNGYVALRYASRSLQNHREAVMKAVSQNGLALEFAAPRLQNDPEIVKIAVRQNGDALQFAGEVPKDDEEIVFSAIRTGARVFHFASPRLRNNPEMVMAAVKCDYHAFSCASALLQNNPEFVLDVVRLNGLALQFASYALRNHPVIVQEAVKQNGDALQYAGESLQNDIELRVRSTAPFLGLIFDYPHAARMALSALAAGASAFTSSKSALVVESAATLINGVSFFVQSDSRENTSARPMDELDENRTRLI